MRPPTPGSGPPSRRGPCGCRPPPPPSRARSPGRPRRWRRRSVSTRVLPDPAGAMTRAGPGPWPTAASWSGARSAAGGRALGHGGSVARPRPTRRTTAARRRPPTSTARGPPSTQAGVPSGRTTSPAAARPSGHGRRRPTAPPWGFPPPDRLDPPAGVVGVGPHEEVEPVVGESKPGRAATGRRGPGRTRPSGAPELGGVDPQGDDDRPAPAQGPWSVDHVEGSLGARRRATARSMVTTGAPDHGARHGSPTLTMTPRPRPGGPGAATARSGRRDIEADAAARPEGRPAPVDPSPPLPLSRAGQVRRRHVGAGDVEVEAQLLGGLPVLVDLGRPGCARCARPARRRLVLGQPGARSSHVQAAAVVLGHEFEEQASSSLPRASPIWSSWSSVSRPGIWSTGTGMPIQAIASSERSARL